MAHASDSDVSDPGASCYGNELWALVRDDRATRWDEVEALSRADVVTGAMESSVLNDDEEEDEDEEVAAATAAAEAVAAAELAARRMVEEAVARWTTAGKSRLLLTPPRWGAACTTQQHETAQHLLSLAQEKDLRSHSCCLGDPEACDPAGSG